MNYEVFVQGRLYKIMNGPSTDKVLTQAIMDIKAGMVEGFDPSQPHNIVLKAIS